MAGPTPPGVQEDAAAEGRNRQFSTEGAWPYPPGCCVYEDTKYNAYDTVFINCLEFSCRYSYYSHSYEWIGTGNKDPKCKFSLTV